MEAAGMAEAVSASGRNVPFVVVRGIADFADESKDDSFREVAAERAVDVGADLLRKLPAGEPEAA
jgi:nucleoside phosphorylase